MGWTCSFPGPRTATPSLFAMIRCLFLLGGIRCNWSSNVCDFRQRRSRGATRVYGSLERAGSSFEMGSALLLTPGRRACDTDHFAVLRQKNCLHRSIDGDPRVSPFADWPSYNTFRDDI